MNIYLQRFKSDAERFMDHTIPCPPSSCLLWEPNGERYGTFWMNGECIGAHRASFLLFKGEIPEGKAVCHSCDVGICVNPDHLFIGSQLDNRRDCKIKGRTARGAVNGNSRFSVDDILRIRELGKRASRREIAEMYKTSRAQIGYILNRTIWSHV